MRVSALLPPCLVAAALAVGLGAAPLRAQSADAEPPALYIADPTAGPRITGLPVRVEPELVAPWPRWFASASGLVMTRTLPAGTTSTGPGLLSFDTSDASASWPGGVDLRLGRWFGARQQNGLELIYWGVYNIGSTTSQTAGADTGSLQRSDLVNDIEINWLSSPGGRPEFMAGDRRVNWMWLAGFRFFQLQDELMLTAQTPATDLDVATNNNIYGGQVGAKFDWAFAPRLRFSAVPKFMIGGNSITNTSTFNATSEHSTLGVFSWLGSVDTLVAWDVTDRWSLWMGYRVVGVGNISQADQQWPATIPPTTADLSGIAAGSQSIVHGGFAGFEARY